MTKGKITRRIIAIVTMVLAAIGFVLIGQEFYFRMVDNNAVRLEGFYEEDRDTIDVVIIGSSEVYQGFSSPQAYKLFGYTSYPMAFETNPVTLWKYELMEVLKTQSPKLVVVEANGAVYNEDNLYKPGAIRYFADAMPFSKDKVEMVRKFGADSEISYYIPFIKYHGRITRKNPLNILTLKKNGHNILRGAFAHSFREEPRETMNVRGDKSTKELHPEAEALLRDFLDYCSKPEMPKVVFVRFPHQTVDERTYNRYKRYNRVGEIVRDYGFDYIDMEDYMDEIGLQKESDWYNGEHLNGRGMEKFTPFFGKLIKDKYGLKETALSEKQKEEWEESARYMDEFYEYYDEFVKENEEKKDKGKNMWDSYAILKRLKERIEGE